MELGRTAILGMAVLTMGLMVGAPATSIVYNGPIPTTVPPLPGVSYTISVQSPNGPAHLEPFFASVSHPGAISVKVTNLDNMQHAYMLRGTGLFLSVGGHQTITMLAYLPHPASYVWINVIPYPGVPSGVTVGILNVL